MLLNTITTITTITNTITSNTVTIAQRDIPKHIFVTGNTECCVWKLKQEKTFTSWNSHLDA